LGIDGVKTCQTHKFALEVVNLTFLDKLIQLVDALFLIILLSAVLMVIYEFAERFL
jgi:hypothetical protein